VHLDTWIPRHLDTWIPRYMDTWIPDHLDTGCTYTCPEYFDTKNFMVQRDKKYLKYEHT